MSAADVARGKSGCECPREHEVFEALAIDGSLAAHAELKAHADGCAICRDVVTVALPLMRENHVAVGRAHPPTSGVVWWRAQMRARNEAAQAVTRPITVIQGLALASFVAVIAAVVGALSPRMTAWFLGLTPFSGLDLSVTMPTMELTSLMPSTTLGMVVAAVGLLVLLVGPLAAYFAFGDE